MLSFLVVLLLVSIDFVNSSASVGKKIVTNEDRVATITSFGYSIEPELLEEKTFVIPTQFSDVYNNYNELQLQGGFNLKNYAGMAVTQYKYKICNEEKYVNIILHNGILIGGDITDNRLNGEMLPPISIPLCKIMFTYFSSLQILYLYCVTAIPA